LPVVKLQKTIVYVYTNFVFAHWAKGPDVTVINTHFHMFSPLRMVPVLRDFNLTKTTWSDFRNGVSVKCICDV